ncbi:putative mei2-like protein [Lupinus albus]|uniref:Putative mei2-like protein n=1 Tax=Lupinus albus TaxID=3870 RepID=A0A6A4NUG7_LUPAL|nr:putative mei2-like protein [Lupinus albus]
MAYLPFIILRFSDLLKILDEHCFELNKTVEDAAAYSKFDFLYLPMDFRLKFRNYFFHFINTDLSNNHLFGSYFIRRHAIDKKLSNLGYAFVNFTSPTAAFKFYKRFNGFIWNVNTNRKTCEINAAQYQVLLPYHVLVHKFPYHCHQKCGSHKFSIFPMLSSFILMLVLYYQGIEYLIRKFHEKVFRCKRSDFLPFVFWEHRDGFNSQVVGTTVGKRIWGLPRKS